MKLKIIFCALVHGPLLCLLQPTGAQTYTGYRSPTVDAARDLITWQYDLCKSLKKSPAYTFISTVDTARSFRPYEIMQKLFGITSDGEKQSIRISGSKADREPLDLLADNFLLPADFKSIVFMKPRISTILFSPNSIWQWPVGDRSAYLQLIFPIVYANYTLALQEYIISSGSYGAAAGYYSSHSLGIENLYPNFTSFAQGIPLTIAPDINFIPLNYARLVPSHHHNVGLAEIKIAGGYGPYFLPSVLGVTTTGVLTGFFSIPTGTRPSGNYLFESLVGNGHHYEAGIGTYGAITFWSSLDDKETADLLLSFNFSHLFPTHQVRSFDLKGKLSSRYVLAAKYTPIITGNLTLLGPAGFQEPNSQFAQTYAPVSHLTHENIKVSVAIQADIAVIFAYKNDKTRWFLGYHFYGRSREHITRASEHILTKQQWALKGTAPAYGFEQNTPLFSPIALSATESSATLFYNKQEASIDNPAPAYSDTHNTGTLIADTVQPGGIDPCDSSLEPIFLSPADIDYDSGRTQALSHALVGSFDHTWRPSCLLEEVTVSLGAQAEFGATTYSKSPIPRSQHCANNALSMWSLWFSVRTLF